MSNKKTKNLHRYNVERQAGRQAGTNVNRTDKQTGLLYYTIRLLMSALFYVYNMPSK